MKLDYVRPALVIIILVLAFGWMHSCESKKEVIQTYDDSRLRTRVTKLVADSVRAQAAIDSILSRRAVDTEKFKSSQKALRIENKALDSKLSRARQTIAVLIDSIPQVKRYVELADSTIAKRDEAIAGLELRLDASTVSHLEEVAALGAKRVAAVNLSKEYEQQVAGLQKQLKKSERGKRFFRATTLVMAGAVGILLLAK
jgi:heme exporter protein D